MSLDLYFHTRPGNAPLDRNAFFAYFQGELYTQQADEVYYSNPDTGVYFHWRWSTAGSEGGNSNKEHTQRTDTYVYFNLNFFRPHTFGLEAAEVLRPFVDHFDLTVDDPQSEGMGQGEFSEEGFLRGWNHGNNFAARAFAQMGEVEVIVGGSHTLPMALNRAYWNWNFRRREIGADFFEIEEIDVYVPPIWFCTEGKQVRSFTLWPNLVPSALPKVDFVLVLRNELAGKHTKRSNSTPAWVPWDEFVANVGDFPLREPSEDVLLPHLVLFADDYPNNEMPPKKLAQWVIALPNWPDKPTQITPDKILDAELVAPSQ